MNYENPGDADCTPRPLSLRRHAHQRRRAAGPHQVDRRLHRLRQTGGLDHMVGPSIGQVEHVVHARGRMRGASLPHQLELLLIGVERDDRPGLRQGRTHDR